MATVTQDELHDTLQALHNALRDAYWDATEMVDKDRIHGVDDPVVDIISELNQQKLVKRTAEYKAISERISKINERLKEIQTDIDKMVHNMETAATVAEAIDKAIEIAGKFFGV